MHPVVTSEHLHRRPAPQALVRPAGIVFLFPQPQPVAPLFGVREAFAVKEFFVVRPVASLDEAVLPRASASAATMEQIQLGDRPLEGCSALRVDGELHGEFEGIVGPDQKKGGSRSRARRSTPATVAEE